VVGGTDTLPRLAGRPVVGEFDCAASLHLVVESGLIDLEERPNVQLSDKEKQELKDLIDRSETLPAKYRHTLFADPHEAELIWPGKTHEVTNVVLPFQSIEQIDEPRSGSAAAQSDLFQMDRSTGRQSGGWTNKLIWGDNKLVLSSLKNGPLRREIENAGGLKLVYIDPPFDVGADFSFVSEVGGEGLTKEPSVIEDIAYRDTWGRGTDSFIAMLYERLVTLRLLLSENGSIYVHIGPNVNHLVRCLMDEVFGSEHYEREIIWQRVTARSHGNYYPATHDSILFYTKRDEPIWNQQYTPTREELVESHYNQIEEGTGRRYTLDNTLNQNKNRPNLRYEFNGHLRTWRWTRERMQELYDAGRLIFTSSGMPRYKRYLDESKGVPLQSVWSDIRPVNSQATEDTGYDTQKPEALVQRIIESSSNAGDLVADFFCGSGTTLAVAEKQGRKWIGCDLGRFAVHTARKRMIGVQRELKADGRPYRSFEILNLGKYERQYFVGIDPTLPDAERLALSTQKEEHYVSLILFAYKAERVFQSPPFHGRKGNTFVIVGPLDAPVTRYQIEEAVDACRKLKASRLDVLGFEFEMGLSPKCVDEAKAKGVSLALRYIPKEVFDKRAVGKGQVVFYDIAYVEVQPFVKGRKVTVKLKDFGVSYRQDDIDVLAGEMKAGTKVTVADGQVIKIAKDKSGVIKREVLTKKWEDWIDYWAVDFDYHSRPETIIVTLPDATGRMVDRPQRTGGFIFENEWQSFRTRRDRKLELESAAYEYAAKGKYKIAVKVIDIFGNDTTKVVEVSV
jgi:adenine-specific DNA-methyltransferase